MQKYPLAVVVVFAFIAGGAAGIVLYHAGESPTYVRGVAEKSVGVSSEAVTEAEGPTSRVAEDARVEDVESRDAGGGDYALTAADVKGEAGDLSGESEDKAEDRIIVPAEKAGRPASGVRRRGETNRRAGHGSVTARRYGRVTGGGSRGGRGVAGHMVGGVKKTGKVIGNAFGKIGGVFHD